LNRKNEWLVVRVADHRQVYFRWLTTLSLAPGNLWWDDLVDFLSQPYGEVGDIL